MKPIESITKITNLPDCCTTGSLTTRTETAAGKASGTVPAAAGCGQPATPPFPWNAPEIPLYLVPETIARMIRTKGDAVYRISVKRTHYHHYNVSMRTKGTRRELAPKRVARIEREPDAGKQKNARESLCEGGKRAKREHARGQVREQKKIRHGTVQR